MTKKPEVNTDAPVAPTSDERPVESFDAKYVAEALENARRQLALVASVRAEYDHALTEIINAQTWLVKAKNSVTTI